MANILDILTRALSLRQETALNSITPDRAGGIMYDTLLVLNQMQLEGSALLISKVYASISAMEADTTPTSDLTGRALKPGQLVVIVPSSSTSSDMGSEYRFNGPGSWTYVGKVGGLPLDTVPTQSSTKGITSGGVYTALAAMKAEGYKYMGLATPGSGGTAPGTPNQPVFYIAGPGTYPNFGSITVASGYLGFIKYSSGSWTVESVAVGKDYDQEISQLDAKVTEKWKMPDTVIPITTTGAHSTYGNYSDQVLNKAGAKCENLVVTPGQKYKIYGTSDSSAYYRIYAVFDADGTRIARADAGDYTTNPVEVTIPSNGAKMTVNLISYNSATDGCFLVGDEYDAKILQGEIEYLQKATNAPIEQSKTTMGVRMKADRYSSVMVDWMQYSNYGAGVNNNTVMSVVSSTETTLTLSAEDAAQFVAAGPVAVHYTDGTVKMVRVKAASGTSVERFDTETVDLTGADYVQNLHDTAMGGAGIHLSQLGYIGLAQFTAQEVASKLSQKDTNLLGGIQFYNASISGDEVKDVYGTKVATIETNFASSGFTPNGNALTQAYGITNEQINASKFGFLYTAFRFQQGIKDNYITFSFPAVGFGCLEIEAGWAPRKPTTSTGSCTMEVYVDGAKVATETLHKYLYLHRITGIDAKGEISVKFIVDGNVDTEYTIYSINFFAMPVMVPAINLTGKKIAVLGDSWTQFPGLANAISLYSSYNTVGTRPDGTTCDGVAYFPKELARVTGATVDNWGKSNMRSDNWGLTEIDAILAYTQYDYLIIEFFTNDVFQDISLDEWAANIALIAEKCKRAFVRPLIMLPCRNNGPTVNTFGIWHEVAARGLGLM